MFLSSENDADEADAKLFSFGGGGSSSAKSSSSTLDKETVYKMDRSTRGIAVIINNKNFLRSSGMDRYPRNGTDVDRDGLAKLFKMLKFDVKVYNDRTKAEIRSITKEMATFNHTNYDAFIFSILTHGEEGVIYGTDGTISIRDLTAEFKYSTSLVGKPKVFLFQACQGEKTNTTLFLCIDAFIQDIHVSIQRKMFYQSVTEATWKTFPNLETSAHRSDITTELQETCGSLGHITTVPLLWV